MEKEASIPTSSDTQVPTEWCRLPQPTPRMETPPRVSPTVEDSIYGAERIERLGGGGFGEVWKVRYLGSDEAWKYIPIRPGSSERTGREAIHARRVEHQNVVRVLDVLKLSDHYVLRMDLVRGKDFFRAINEDGVIGPDEAVGYGIQVAQALAYAHRQGVVHLDLKPHNLILCEDGARVMVTDFGISASLARDPTDLEAGVGTPFFMAPEQFESASAVGSGIDIWSLAVTLYWSMSLGYPFRFEGRDPKEVIRTETPIPLSDVQPYIPRQLSDLLSRMLQYDPAKRPADMDEVVAVLEAYRDSPRDASARAGDRAFANCQFDEAIQTYKEAVRHPPVGSDQPARARLLLEAAREGRAEHDAQVSRIDTRIAEDDLAGALLTLGVARRRFSRSRVLRDQRLGVEAAVQNRFSTPRRLVERDLRRARFADARLYLERLTALLGVPGARKLILAARSGEAVIDSAGVQRLRATVDEREALFGQLNRSIEEAVQAMDFTRGRDTLEELQNHFPVPDNLHRMRVFAEAAEHLAFLADYPPVLLAAVASGEVNPSAERPFLLARAESRCHDLLRLFDPNVYPNFRRIQDQAKGLGSAIQMLRVRAQSDADAIRESHRRGDTARVRRILHSSRDIILHTDVINEELRVAVRDIERQLQGLIERAERLYGEGVANQEKRQFNKAITAFEEVLRIGGVSHKDIDERITACSEAAENRRRLAEDLHALDLSIAARGVVLADAKSYLPMAERLLGLQEDARRAETLGRTSLFLTGLVEAAAREAAGAPAEKRLTPMQELAAVIACVSSEFLRQIASAAAGLSVKLAALVEATLGQMDAGAGEAAPAATPEGGPEERLVELHNLIDILSGLRPILSASELVGDQHPCGLVADHIYVIAKPCATSRNELGEALARDAADLLVTLADLAPPPVSDEIRETRHQILESLRRQRIAAKFAILARRVARVALPALISLALVTAVGLAWTAGDHRARAHQLEESVHALKREPRWASVEGQVLKGEDFAQMMRLLEHDLPAFASLDGVCNPDARFWARLVSGVGILSQIAPDRSPLLGRSGIRSAVEDTLTADLESAVQAWVEEVTEPFPLLQPAQERGFAALHMRLDTVDRLLLSLGELGGGRGDQAGLMGLRVCLDSFRQTGEALQEQVEAAPRFAVDLLEGTEAEAPSRAAGFWREFLLRRMSAPSPAWRRILDSGVANRLAEALRASLRRRAAGGSTDPNSERIWGLISLIARIREIGGPLPLDPNWSAETDPIHSVVEPIVR